MEQKNNIIVIGDIMVDHYIYGKCDRISPEAPVPVVNFNQEQYTLGGAGNVIKNLYALGSSSQLLAACGEDDAAWQLEKQLEATGIDFYYLAKEDDRPTTIKTRDRKSTRLNSSHVKISYAVFCLKKKSKPPT